MARLLLCCVMLLIFPIIGQAKTNIGVSMSAFDDYFLSLLRDAIADEAQEMSDVTLQFTDAKQDTTRQQAQIDEFIAKKYAVIIVNPVDVSAESTGLMSQKTRAAGIPLVFVNRKPDIPLGNGVYYVGSDSYLSGKLQMEYLAESSNGEGDVAIMMGIPNSGVARDRTQAVKDVIALHPKMHIIVEGVANFNRTEGERLMSRWIHEGKHFNMLAANNDEMALGALLAMRKAGISPRQIKITGIDATPEALYAMYQNELTATVFQDAEAQGKVALNTAAALAAKSDKLPAEILIPYQLVTPENYRMYLRR
nr:substrate-binding domain-containing protein [uncultured Tolumonas sp.]